MCSARNPRNRSSDSSLETLALRVRDSNYPKGLFWNDSDGLKGIMIDLAEKLASARQSWMTRGSALTNQTSRECLSISCLISGWKVLQRNPPFPEGAQHGFSA